MPANPGHLPPECIIEDEQGEVVGYRPVHVTLFNGWSSRKAGAAPWPSRTSNWTIQRASVPSHGFDIEFWEIIK